MGDDIVSCLTLARTRGVGPMTYRQLLRHFGTAKAALAALPDLVRRGGGSGYVPVPAERIERELSAVDCLGARHILFGDAAYPPLLAQMDGAPVVLIARGDPALTGRPAIAMVGARNASAAACAFARQLARDLGEAGQLVVSGLARGIDSAAHIGAIDTGTIAVIGNGHDMTFPPENAALQDRLCRDHLVLSEYPPGTEPLARHFPHRNRIIAGMCAGTVVVEAAPRSGSLLTARLAAEAGREVMAVPGSPVDPRARGCNQLIREGATLIQNAIDILEAIGPIAQGMPTNGHFGHDDDDSSCVRQPCAGELHDESRIDDRDRHRVAALLGPVAVSVDELIRQSDLSAAVVQSILLEMELAGRIGVQAGGRVALKS